jgi:alpha-beta hydrolase superfamily lysophospholipase
MHSGRVREAERAMPARDVVTRCRFTAQIGVSLGGTVDREVTSADGTTLSARVSGRGSPLVLVHGTTGSKESWALVERGLAGSHTVWSYDRRGRGDSADDPARYALEREVDDLVAVLDDLGEPAHLLGHSFGGCGLDATVDDITDYFVDMLLTAGQAGSESPASP